MELVAVSPAGRQIIERYAASGFRVSGVVYQGPVLVFPDRTVRWAEAALTAESLAPVVEHGGIELLLLGVGRRMVPVAASLRASLKAGGVALEVMDTESNRVLWRDTLGAKAGDLIGLREQITAHKDDVDKLCAASRLSRWIPARPAAPTMYCSRRTAASQRHCCRPSRRTAQNGSLLARSLPLQRAERRRIGHGGGRQRSLWHRRDWP